MKLYFTKSGGFAPIFQGCRFDSAQDRQAECKELEELVRASGIMQETSKRVPQARDVFYYTFEIELDGQKQELTFDQLSVPDSCKQLLEFLLCRSKNMLPE